MSVRIYMASKTTHAPKWRELRAAGLPIISTWIDEAGAGETQCFKDLWQRCVHEAAMADVTIVYREPGEVLKGAFVEAGAALSAFRRVFAIGCDEFSFVNHPGVRQVDTLEEALAAVSTYAPAKPFSRGPLPGVDGDLVTTTAPSDDPIEAFARDCLVMQPGDFMPCQAAYEAFAAWCDRRGRPALKIQSFYGRLGRLVPHRRGYGGGIGFGDVRLKDNAPDDITPEAVATLQAKADAEGKGEDWNPAGAYPVDGTIIEVEDRGRMRYLLDRSTAGRMHDHLGGWLIDQNGSWTPTHRPAGRWRKAPPARV